MSNVVSFFGNLLDQLNPFNTGNLVLYFSWVVVFSFTVIGLWLSQRRWVRLFCYLVNQLFSVGMVVSVTVTALLAYTFWWQSLIAASISVAIAWFIFSGD
ncbi:MAG: hypothetical protein ACE5JZ_10795 [Kiloniellales bacterium]